MDIGSSICPRVPQDGPSRRGMHPLVAAAAGALDDADVRWALLRGEHDLGDPRGDVDILVDGSRAVSAVERALRPLGIVAVPQVGAGAHRLFVGHHRPTRRWIEFDVEWDLDFGPQHHFTFNWLAPALRSGVGQAVLARRRRSPDLPGLWVLHPDDAFWALLLHVIVDKAAVQPHHADRLVVLSEDATATGPLARVVAAACPPGWGADRLIRCARAREWPALVALGRVLARRSCIRHPVAHRVGALVRGLHRLGRSLSRVLTTPGVSVAVVGTNGAGRSVLVAGLLAEQRLRARLVRHPLAATYHRLRGRAVVVEAPHADGRPADVVVELNPGIPVSRELLADAVAAVWRARSGHRTGCATCTGARVIRTMPGTSTTATTNCVAR
jgi:hypothetical protein